MPHVDMKDLLQHASREGYAVCAFDLAGLDFLTAVTAAAEGCRAPLVLSVAEAHLDYIDGELLAPAIEAAARRARVPVAIQFHRAGSVESVRRAIRLGSNCVTIAGSHRSFEENIAAVRAAADTAHACGVPVEGGLNAILRSSSAMAFPDAVTPEMVREFVERTGVDFLAIADVRDNALARPQLHRERLAQLRNKTGIPLTLDGNQRFSEAEHRQLIECGVAKIHHYVGLSRAAAQCLRQNIKATHRNGYLTLVKGVREAIHTEAELCLKLSGSAGRADRAASQCRPWRAVEPVIHGNVITGAQSASTRP